LKEKDQVTLIRELCRNDLYFLLRYPLGRHDIERDWLFERCREVQAHPNGYLDLWAREHYKSSIITVGKTIQDILASHGENPLEEWNGREATIVIFSHTRGIAKGFLREIMRELAFNQTLKELFPDILYEDPKKSSPKWSEDDGIIIKRKSNPKESTVEAWGIVDGQPTSKHFLIRVYDDVVTQESTRSADMMTKTTDSWALSSNLGVRGGFARYIGTRYHFNDTYKEIMRRKAAIPRLYPATENGLVEGEPVLLTREELEEKRRTQGSYTFGCQMLQDPVADSVQGFKKEWLQFYATLPDKETMNIFILVDPANEKKKKSDYTAMIVIGAAKDQNLYVLDIVRDRLNLLERTDRLFELHKKWKPSSSAIKTGYEKYGKDADIEHIKDKQDQENYHFHIKEVGGPMAKNDRIRRLVPGFESGTIFLPKTLNYVNYENKSLDLVKIFIEEEYEYFPVGEHDDMLDALARIKDMNVEYPSTTERVLNFGTRDSSWGNKRGRSAGGPTFH